MRAANYDMINFACQHELKVAEKTSFIVLLRRDGADQPDERGPAREDHHDIGPAPGLLVLLGWTA